MQKLLVLPITTITYNSEFKLNSSDFIKTLVVEKFHNKSYLIIKFRTVLTVSKFKV